MTHTNIKINIKSLEIQYGFDDGEEICTLNIKSELKFKIGKEEMIKEISNTVCINNEEIIRIFREEKNKNILNEFIGKRKNRDSALRNSF